MDEIVNTEEWLARVGEALRDLRLSRNLGQAELARRAGTGRTAIQNIESGHGTLSTLVRVVRALGREDWLQSLVHQPTINPLHLVRHAQKRQRASGGRGAKPSPQG